MGLDRNLKRFLNQADLISDLEEICQGQRHLIKNRDGTMTLQYLVHINDITYRRSHGIGKREKVSSF